MKLTIDVNDNKLLALSQLSPYLGLDHRQFATVDKEIKEVAQKLDVPLFLAKENCG
jgi:hypothetical protein